MWKGILGFRRIVTMPASTELFRRYPNKWFVETGSYKGDGIQCAIDAGFSNIRSIELSANLFRYCWRRFSKTDKRHSITVLHGKSENELPKSIQGIKKPITFWLDAHYSEGCTAKGDEMSPILKELAIIAEHPVKTHTILIDDVRQFGTKHFGFIRENQIVEVLKKINPDYKLTYDTGDKKFQHDVLVARV
jgi:hypothetical protein